MGSGDLMKDKSHALYSQSRDLATHPASREQGRLHDEMALETW
jgi:hypothetical protein